MEQERRNHWSFVIAESGAWSWRVLHPDSSASVSAATFPTLKACVADAALHGYVLPNEEEERRRERRTPPSVMIAQEVQCPWCRHSWDLRRSEFLVAGDSVTCRQGCGQFRASSESVRCVVEQADGLLEIPLPDLRR